MIYKEHLFKILKFPHFSEKSASVLEKCNVVVFITEKYATKSDIKNSVSLLFSVQIKSVNIVMFKKCANKNFSSKAKCRDSFKKAYVFLKPGQKIDFLNKLD